jgi:hypothetical protein
MNNKKATQILIIIVIVAVVVLAIYLLGKNGATPAPVQTTPVADTGKFAPKLNNTLETSVTVVNPTDTTAPQK